MKKILSGIFLILVLLFPCSLFAQQQKKGAKVMLVGRSADKLKETRDRLKYDFD